MRVERLNDDIVVCVSEDHRFGSDAFLLCDFACPRSKDRVWDLGTGCGIIPMIMCKRFIPQSVVGVDIQGEAIELFAASIEQSKTSTVLTPMLCDLKDLATDRNKNAVADVVTCNPPYKISGNGIISGSGADKIARHETACTISDVCKAAQNLLRFGGKLCICQRPERLLDVMSAMRENKIEPKRVRFVSKGSTDAPWLVLVEGKKGAKPFLQVEAGLYMYDGDEFSPELKRVYGS